MSQLDGEDILASVTGITAEEGANPAVWAVLRMGSKRKGQPLMPASTLENTILILERDPRWVGRIAGNTFDGMVYLDEKLISDEKEIGIYRWLVQHYLLDVSAQRVSEAVRYIATQNQTHPVRDYLEALKWDGEERLGLWLSKHCGAEDTDLVREMGTRWAVSCVARVMSPGCQVDTCLILAGPQGAKKSSAFRALAVRDEWFADSSLDLRNKDAYQALQGIWIYELAELDSVRRADANAVKAFLTARWDRYRPAYGRNLIRWGRQNVFVGTTNEQAFLSDPTGSRRFWPVRVGAIDVPALTAERDQLWAEAVTLYRVGERWYLQGESEAALVDASGDYQQTDPWRGTIEEWADGQDHPFKLDDVLTKALKRVISDSNNGHQMRAAAVLTQLGFSQRRIRIVGQKRSMRWWKGTFRGDEW